MEPTEPLTEERLLALVNRGEGTTVEFKTQAPDPRTLAHLIAAFANASGGVILVGIRDDGKVVGCDSQRLSAALSSALERLHPEPVVTLEQVRIRGAGVGAIQVSSAQGIVLSDGSAVTRVGSTVRPMGPEQLRERFGEQTQQAWLEELFRTIALQTQTIESLRAEVQKTGSLWSKMKDYLIGGIIGAILGWLLSVVIS